MSGDLIHFQSVLTKADRARMELERELDDLNERLEEQGGATQAQVSKINKLVLNFFISRPQRKSRALLEKYYYAKQRNFSSVAQYSSHFRISSTESKFGTISHNVKHHLTKKMLIAFKYNVLFCILCGNFLLWSSLAPFHLSITINIILVLPLRSEETSVN